MHLERDKGNKLSEMTEFDSHRIGTIRGSLSVFIGNLCWNLYFTNLPKWQIHIGLSHGQRLSQIAGRLQVIFVPCEAGRELEMD